VNITRTSRVVGSMRRRFSIRVRSLVGVAVVGACAFVLFSSQAQASCGDWLVHTSSTDTSGKTNDNQSQTAGSELESQSTPPVTPCHGLECSRRSSEPIGLPPPPIEPNGQERWCQLWDELLHLPPSISYGVSMNTFRARTVVHPLLLRPPSSRLLLSAAA
jgi:hypothetical protein